MEYEEEDSASHYDLPIEKNTVPRVEPSTSEGAASFPFAHSRHSNDSATDSSWPSATQLPYLWRTFQTNVDPFVKVLHIPSLDDVLRQSNFDISTLSASMQALLSSISFAAAISLSEEEVRFSTFSLCILANSRRRARGSKWTRLH
jgi:hypothetical protein